MRRICRAPGRGTFRRWSRFFHCRFKGESICMYQRLQSPSQFHHLWIVLAIISDILLPSCSTTPTTGAPTPVGTHVSQPTPTPNPAATSAPLLPPTPHSTARTLLLVV